MAGASWRVLIIGAKQNVDHSETRNWYHKHSRLSWKITTTHSIFQLFHPNLATAESCTIKTRIGAARARQRVDEQVPV
jgi:hypothetical protein